MELPHLGKNCHLPQCNRLDFLPVKCDACNEVFCIEHYKYDSHNCEKAKRKDVQVPVCPLCSEPVVSRRGELPDVAVSQHIDQYCKQNSQLKDKSVKPKTNLQACNYKACKQKDLIYLECNDCQSKFCIKHRHPSDHSCPGPSIMNNFAGNWESFKGSCSNSASSSFSMIRDKAQQISKSSKSYFSRLSNGMKTATDGFRSQNANGVVNKLQGNISEDEALARALSASRTHGRKKPASVQQQEEEDQALARALQESQMQDRA